MCKACRWRGGQATTWLKTLTRGQILGGSERLKYFKYSNKQSCNARRLRRLQMHMVHGEMRVVRHCFAGRGFRCHRLLVDFAACSKSGSPKAPNPVGVWL